MRGGGAGEWANLADDVSTQAHRTADWLGALPLHRLLADGAAITVEAHDIVVELDRATRVVAGGNLGGDVGPECPPPGAVAPRLAPHAAGDQLRVFADQLARAVAVHGVDRGVDPESLRTLAARCLTLRNRPR